LNLATPIAVQNLVNNVAFGTLLQPLVVLAVIVFGSLLLAGALRAVQVIAVEYLQRRLFVRMVGDVAWRLPRAKVDAFSRGDGGELVNRFFDVFTVQKAVAGLLLDGVSVALQAVVGMLLLAFYHPFLLAFDAVLVGALFFIVVVLGRGAIATAVTESKRKYQVVWWLEQVGRHAVAFKQSGGGAFARDRADALARNWLDARHAHFMVHLRQVIGALLFQALASTGLLVLGGFLVIERQLTLGQLVAAEIVVATVVAAFAKLGKHLESWYDLVAAADKLGELLDVPVEEDTGDDLQDVQLPLAVQLRDTKIAVAGRCWLNGASISLRPGARVAILGGPGSGKSHVAEAIAGLQIPTGGQVLLDQVDTSELRPMQRGRYAVMARDPAFVSGTVAENIRMGRVEVSVADVRWALRILGIDDAVHRLPDGIRTRLDGEGRPLGDEERDLLMLARAIVGRPRLLVVDSMLDRLSPEARRRTLLALSAPGGPWTFVITTRDAALADELPTVWELEGGTITVRKEPGPGARLPPALEPSPG
jgi:ABC-type bacteriocin/lantibiotic exporter with double-glycine peptidase domain